MALLAKLLVPIEAESTVRKVVLSDRYLVMGKVSGWITALDLASTDQSQHQISFQADTLWDLDCRDDTIATANENGTVTLWDAQTGARKVNLVGHTDLVKLVLLPSHGPVIISGSKDTNIIVWDAVTNTRRSTLTEHRERITMLKTFDNLLVSASSDGIVKVWDLNTYACLRTFEGHSGWVLPAGMNADGSLLATGSMEGIIIWSMEKGVQVANCAGYTGLPITLANTTDPNILMAGCGDGTIRSWEWTSGDPVRTIDAHNEQWVRGVVTTNGQCVRGVVFTEKLMISGGMDGSLKIWDRETWQSRGELRGRVQNVYHVVKRNNLLAVALLLTKGTSIVELWDLTDLDDKCKVAMYE